MQCKPAVGNDLADGGTRCIAVIEATWENGALPFLGAMMCASTRPSWWIEAGNANIPSGEDTEVAKNIVPTAAGLTGALCHRACTARDHELESK